MFCLFFFKNFEFYNVQMYELFVNRNRTYLFFLYEFYYKDNYLVIEYPPINSDRNKDFNESKKTMKRKYSGEK